MDNFQNKIFLGDCIEEMKNIPDRSIDCIITDPLLQIWRTGFYTPLFLERGQ